MKKTILITTASAFCGLAHAATLQSVISTGAPSSDGWAITLTSGDAGQNGDFSGNSGTNGDGSGAGAGASAWALYANTGQTASAVYTLAGGGLSIGQSLSLDFDNGNIDLGGSVGMVLLNGGTEAFAFTFTGGDANYSIFDGATTDTGVGFTDDGQNVSITLTSAGTYSVDGTLLTGTFNNGQTTIDEVRVFNFNAGAGGPSNLFFNNLSVTQVPEPSSSALLTLAGLALILRRRK